MGSQISVQISQVKIQKLFLGGLSDSATPEEVAELFERFGAKVNDPHLFAGGIFCRNLSFFGVFCSKCRLYIKSIHSIAKYQLLIQPISCFV